MRASAEAITTSLKPEFELRRSIPDDDGDRIDELPPSMQKVSNTNTSSTGTGKRSKHSKKLSLNFPILVPAAQESPRTANGSISNWSQSPTVSSPYRSSTPMSSVPFPSPDDLKDGFNPTEGPDFLTLIAGQERKVMELKEELSKAESALIGLKRQWAIFEAKKKQSELRNKTVKLGPVSPKSATTSAEDEELERTKRRELREQKMREFGMAEGELGRSDSTNGRRNGGRVFAGRHTRTLSLLQNNNLPLEAPSSANRPKSRTESSPSSTQPTEDHIPNPHSERTDREEQRPERRSLSRQPTLQELIANSATGAAQMNFGKTYKDLAHASRKSLPPGTDIFVKQGKQVYDGVSQGFWNFVEDIRQATVGDEAVNGAPVEQRREVKKSKSNRKLSEHHTCDKHGKVSRGSEEKRRQRKGDENKPEKDTFWKEFGLETPKNAAQAEANPSRKASSTKRKEHDATSKDHESKSSTDSKCPPSLLADLMDVNEDDEAWDNWPVESPVAHRQTERSVNIRQASEDESEDSISLPSSRSEKQFAAKNNKAIEASWAELIA